MSTLNSSSYISQKQGEYFGYPKCCVRSFLRYMSGTSKRDPIQVQASHPEGFVPCKMHAKVILTKKVKVMDLLENRVSLKEFQQSNYQGDFVAALEENQRFQEWLKLVESSEMKKKKDLNRFL